MYNIIQAVAKLPVPPVMTRVLFLNDSVMFIDVICFDEFIKLLCFFLREKDNKFYGKKFCIDIPDSHFIVINIILQYIARKIKQAAFNATIVLW